METRLKMIYWKSDRFWVGKLLDHPEIMTQGETLEELEENMKDAYLLMTMEDVPPEHEVKELAIRVEEKATHKKDHVRWLHASQTWSPS